MKRNVIIAFWLFILLFALMAFNLVHFTLFEAEKTVTSPYNPRVSRFNESVNRGTIFDRNGEAIAESEKNGDIYERKYLYPEAFAHITGYTANGVSGLEAKYNFTLQSISDELLQRIYAFFGSDEPRGNDLYLTMDKNVQLAAYSELKGKKGAIVVSEVKTGKIIALASNPSFDPEKVGTEWDRLISSDDSPLLCRAVQGLYPPGSTFKILTALTAVKNYPEYTSFKYKCSGTEEFKDKVISCYNKAVHGNIDIRDAMRESCNTFFAKLGTMLGAASLKETAKTAFFDSEYDFELPKSVSRFSLEENSSVSEIVETSIGQGKTLVTPLHLNMITAAVGNYGTMMKPYLADYSKDYADKMTYINEPEHLTQICSVDEAAAIAEMLDYSVTQKTDSGENIAGKTGTAENPFGEDHSWFTAYAPSENPLYAVTIVFENNGKGSKAIPAAKKLLSMLI